MASSQNSVSKKRRFNSAYEEAFLVLETPVGSMCLLCEFVFSDNRRFNFKRHFENYHADFDAEFPKDSQSRADEIKLLKSKSRKVKSFENFDSINCDVNASTAVSYRVSHLLIKSGKPFTDGELIKSAFKILSEEFFKETAEKSKLESAIHDTSLSARTVVRRLDSMNSNLVEQLANDIALCAYFSLQLDESTDVKDSAQLNVFIRLVFDDMSSKEELFDTISLKESTQGPDAFTSFKNSLLERAVPLKKLVAITTDGDAAMLGKDEGLVNLCKKDPDFPTFVSFQCLIRQVSLSANAVKMSQVVNIVLEIVNSIKARPLLDRLFLRLGEEEESELKLADSSLNGEVGWLSLGKVLKRFWELLPHIKEFLKSKNERYDQLEDPKWLLDLNFLVDLTNELNLLNLSLQGRDHPAWRLLAFIDNFKYKLNLCINDFRENKVSPASFPNVQKCSQSIGKQIDFSAQDFAKYLETLLQNIETRFQDWKDVRVFKEFSSKMLDIEKINLRQVLQSLSDLNPNIDGGKLTNEILNLQTDEHIYARVKVERNFNIWNSLTDREYPTLLSTYKRMLSIFGSTYLCESSFSTMKNIKSRYRSNMTDEHVGQVMRMCTSTYEPDISRLVTDSQCRSSRN